MDSREREEFRAVIRKNFGNNVRILRTAKGWTQQQLADALKWHRITVTRIENGINLPHYDDACQMADALGVDVGRLRVDLFEAKKN